MLAKISKLGERVSRYLTFSELALCVRKVINFTLLHMSAPAGTFKEEIRFKGIGVSPGVVVASLVVVKQEETWVPSTPIEESDIPVELSRFHNALLQTREQIQKIQEHISHSIGEKNASIFDAHLLVLEDHTLLEAVKNQLYTKKRCVEWTYHELMTAYARSMREIGDTYLRERASDLVDVGRRVLDNLMGKKVVDIYQLEKPSVIVAHDLSPSHTALIDRKSVLAFATDVGSPTSHSAIMARSLNIPAIVGLQKASLILKSGDDVLLDGYHGLLIINPSEKTLAEYGQLAEQRLEVRERLSLLRETQGVTRDGRRILISANVELPEDLPLLQQSGAEGIGLYRTEFLFLNRLELPSEEEQMQAYRAVLEAGGDHGAIVRTLDIGGDKMPTHTNMDEELNPFLGWRAIRYCLQEVHVFKTQLRAICRAGAGRKTRLMFPMIAVYEELIQARHILEEVLEGLRKEGLAHAEHIEVGMMIEVPTAALIADKLVDHIDFFSIGTNDLIGYALAVDRTNSKVAYLYQPTHPGIIRLIHEVIEVAHAKGKWVGICGETAGDIHLTPLLVGLGVDELSMGSIFIPRVKRAVQSLSYEEMKQMVSHLGSLPQAAQIAEELKIIAQKYYPELLI